jgi:RNA polymerase sigma-70 factor, ECF subfamily
MASRNQRLSAPPQEFEAICTRYSPILYRMALRKLGDPEDAKDAVQDALFSAFRHISQFDGRARLSTWLGGIVLNSARMHLRRQCTHAMQSLDAIASDREPAFMELLRDPGPSPFEVCHQGELRQIFRSLLRRFPPHLRDAIQLCKIDGLTQSEAAQVLNVKIGTVKCRLHRGRIRLTLLLRSKGLMPLAEEQENHRGLFCNS